MITQLVSESQYEYSKSFFCMVALRRRPIASSFSRRSKSALITCILKMYWPHVCLQVRFHMLITGLTATSDSNYANVSVAFTSSVINASMDSVVTVENIDFQVRVDIRTARIGQFTTVLNRTLDLCASFKNPLMDPLTALFFEAIPPNNSNNHVFNSCPIKAVYFLIHIFL